MKLNRLLKIILVIFLFCIYSFTNAQTLTVYKFEEDKTDLEAYYNEVKDINGEKCALIKVLINNIDINKILFETKGIEVKKIEKKPPTQIWVYVSPQTQGLVISTAGYGNINYYEFITGPLKSTKTYIMDLRTDIKLKLVEEKIIPVYEYVKLKISPEDKGVEVWIDGIKKGLTPLQSTPQLTPGIHKIKLIKNLYHDLETNINVVFNGDNSFNFTLKPKFGKLNINSNGDFNEAIVYLDEEEKGKTPLNSLLVISGNHRLVIKKDLYADYNENFEMTDGGIKEIELTALNMKPIYATINLRTNPTNADIYINKEKLSSNGILTNYKASSGSYFIEAKLKKYKDFQKNIILKEQENYTETIQLEPQVGELNIETTPEDCDIYLNGVKQNRLTPAVLRNIQVGSYQLELKKEGFTSIKKQIEIKEGETTKIFEKLIAGITIPIITEPSNATIEIDGIYLGISPISYKFTIGKNYNIKITKENYKPINETIFITENVNKLPIYNLEKLEKILPIITEPSNTRIYIDDNYIGISPISYKFTIGKNYNIKITKENYKPINETIFITENVNKLPVYNLEKLEKILPIITEPTNATITIDGNYIGISPISYKFTIGKNYNIKITKENYKPINESVYISENIDKLPIYNLEKLITEKTLPIITEPNNARIEIDDNYIGISPINYNFKIGINYNIKITKENYKPINESVYISENINKLPIYNLEKVITEKTLPIITEPNNARIDIDDNYIGISPINYNFKIGKNYNIKITKENYKPINESVYISENIYKLPIFNLEKDINLIYSDLPKTEMVFVQGGTFTMGCTDEQGNDCAGDEKPTHQVTLSDYYIGKYEVTQGLWKKVMGSNPSYFKYCGDDCPVESVSWDDCQEFISKLNQLTGKRFRLPTEAEWEYAARGGSKASNQTKYAGSNYLDVVSWNFENSDVNYIGGYESNGRKFGTHIVGIKKSNALGIYDMNGNVWEWCNDWYGVYRSIDVTNPHGPSSGLSRVLRGGSLVYYGNAGRVSSRGYNNTNNSPYSFDYGLRLVSP